MDIAGYFESVKDRILTDSSVLDLKVLKEVDRSNNGHLRARVLFTDKSVLKFSEFIEQNANDEIRLVTYLVRRKRQPDPPLGQRAAFSKTPKRALPCSHPVRRDRGSRARQTD
ncbi:MAG: hypothetical protein DCC59_11620 [Chloroflexi bacterium]|nr:hypothetical protein [Chloroflexi bacterium CFX1]MCQ3954468.1 hypothetical protein [Chloroflexota bacterium]RIK51512.1 MAG: hypothetical protein DCC59_11620 [Chloroflexota bacterium]